MNNSVKLQRLLPWTSLWVSRRYILHVFAYITCEMALSPGYMQYLTVVIVGSAEHIKEAQVL